MNKISNIRGEIYNRLTLEEQMELLKCLPIGSYVNLNEGMGTEGEEYRIVGYTIESDISNKEWLNLKLDKDIDGVENKIIHPGFATKSKRSIRNEKLKELGI